MTNVIEVDMNPSKYESKQMLPTSLFHISTLWIKLELLKTQKNHSIGKYFHVYSHEVCQAGHITISYSSITEN